MLIIIKYAYQLLNSVSKFDFFILNVMIKDPFIQKAVLQNNERKFIPVLSTLKNKILFCFLFIYDKELFLRLKIEGKFSSK